MEGFTTDELEMIQSLLEEKLNELQVWSHSSERASRQREEVLRALERVETLLDLRLGVMQTWTDQLDQHSEYKLTEEYRQEATTRYDETLGFEVEFENRYYNPDPGPDVNEN